MVSFESLSRTYQRRWMWLGRVVQKPSLRGTKMWGQPVSNFRAITAGVAIILACAAVVLLWFRG